ncbi:hypothetical protein QMN02_18360, partial [Leptospira santarosai]|nr:hypothetical protein [Leptospira santarosai]
MPSLKEELDISLLEKHQARNEARGRLSPSKMLTTISPNQLTTCKALVGAVGGAAGAAVKSFTGGAVTVGLSYSAENGFGASVGVGYGPATVSVGISERGGTTVDVGFNKAGFNAGLSYNSKTGQASVNAGLEV